MGLISGTLVDKLHPVKWCFVISGSLSLIGFLGLIYPIGADPFGILAQLMTIFFMFIAGLGGSIAMISSIVVCAKNFDSQVSILLVSILITYLKTASALDFDFGKVANPTPDVQMIVMGILSSIVYFGGILFVHQVTFDESNREEITKNDRKGVLVMVVIVALYLTLYWVLDIMIGSKLAGLIVIIVFIGVNFIFSQLSFILGSANPLLKSGPASDARAAPPSKKILNDFKLT